MKRYRLFFAAQLPYDVRKKLSLWIDAHRELPVRWTKEENLHVTIRFVGNADETEMVRLATGMDSVLRNLQAFQLSFTAIQLAPSPARPRLIWCEGEADERFAQAVDALDAFSRGNGQEEEFSVRALRPHITLGRIKSIGWRELRPKPKLSERFHANIPVDSMVLMESRLDGSGPEYTVLQAGDLSTE